MTFEHVRVQERERAPARASRSRLGRLLSLGVLVPAVAFASCKKNETATPSDQAPADTARTSQAAPSDPGQPADETPIATNAEPTTSSPQADSDMEAVATSSGTTGAPSAAPAEPSSGPDASAGEKPASPAAPTEPSPSAAAAPAPEHSAPSDTPSTGSPPAGDSPQVPHPSLNATPAVYEGWKHFSANCERCHGQDAVGSSFAPSLLKSIREGSVLGTGPLTHDVYIGTVVAGRPAKGMPAWVELLDREKMENIWAYLTARASGQLAPGRPIKQGG